MMTNDHPVGDCLRGPEWQDPTAPVGPSGFIFEILKWLFGGGGVIRGPISEPGPPEMPGPWERPLPPGYPRPGPDEWVIRRSATAGVPGE